MYPISFSVKGGSTLGYMLIALAMTLVANFIIGAIFWPWVLNTLLVFAGKPAVVLWWQGGLLGMVPGFAYLGIIGAICVWIFMLFV